MTRELRVYPGTLAEALQDPDIFEGHRIVLHGGTYSGDFNCTLNNIVVMPYPGESAVIDGKMDVNGADVTIQDLEFKYSGWTTRETETSGSEPPDIPIDKGLTLYGARDKVINCVIHDVSGGMAAWSQAVDAEIYGNLIFNGGWTAPDRGHGHAIYTQNNDPTHPKIIENNIIFNQFADNLTAIYGNSEVSGYTITGNTLFGGEACILGGDEAINAQYNYFYNITASFDSRADYSTIRDLIVKNNYMHSKTADRHTLNISDWKSVDCQNNIVVSIPPATFDNPLSLIHIHEAGALEIWNNNIYYHSNALNPFKRDLAYKTFEEWQALGYDADSTFTTSAPAANVVFVRVNTYKTGRGNITIYNWQGLNTVTVDVSSVLSAGDSYRLISVQAYFTDIATGTVAGDGTISVDMQAVSHAVTKPTAWEGDWYATTFPQFGAFVVEKVA